MAGHEWDDWFEREELIGQISDIRVQNLQAEREGIQKRTFTKWMNLHLEKCNPPLEITDLFNEIRDGRVLMALLEELSGCKLLHGFKQSSHRIFRLNNIAKVLNFLEERNVKLISIDAADVADGNSSLVLGLIWNIILFFQIKELTGTIQSRFSSTSSLSSLPNSTDSDTSHPGTPAEEKAPSHPRREHGKAIRTLLQWVQRRTTKYGVVVQEFGKSWVSGLAFLAVIKSIDSSLVDIRKARLRTPKQNLEDAFRIAHYSLGIPRLLEPEDVMISTPEEQSIMTYVSQFLEHFPGHGQDETTEATERGPPAASRGAQQDRVSINGVHREKPRPYMLRKDSVPPPPKIFISSVPDDVEQASPAKVDVPENSQLDKESCPELDKSPKRPVDLGKEVVSVSPQLSSMDSAIDSPDSWSEMTSEATLLDSPGLLMDSPCPISPSEEKVSPDAVVQEPSVLGKVKEGPVFKEPFVGEGSVLQTSVDSFQTDSKLSLEEEDAYQYILGLNEDKKDSESPPEEAQNGLGVGLESTGMSVEQSHETTPLELSGELKSKDLSHKMENGLGSHSEQNKASLLQDKSNTKPTTPHLCEEKKTVEMLPEPCMDLVTGVHESETAQEQNDDVTTKLPAGTSVDLVGFGDFSLEASYSKQEESCPQQKYPVEQDFSGSVSGGQECRSVPSGDQGGFECHSKTGVENLDQNHTGFSSEDLDHTELQDKNNNLDHAADLSEDLDNSVLLSEDQEFSRCYSDVQNTNRNQFITAHSENMGLSSLEPEESYMKLDQHHISMFEGQVHARLIYAVGESDDDRDLPLDLLSDAPSDSNVGFRGINECRRTNTDVLDVGPLKEASSIAFHDSETSNTSQGAPGEAAKQADLDTELEDFGFGPTPSMDAHGMSESSFAVNSALLDFECASGSCHHSFGSEDWSQQNQATGVKPGSLRVFCTICGKEKMEEANSPQLQTDSEVCEVTTAATPRKAQRSSVAAAPPGGMTAAELRLLLLLWLLLYCLLVLPQLDLRTLPHLLLNLEE
ncbi:uncharacterized protein clmna [Paramormyrops kingsleyae]|uniref:uncharacterized protein clmna n=1 Tax=Paramormyrops kingsleyae TaxID=1676925 RepID=UPI003B975EAE